MKVTFNFSLLQALYAAYLVARAEIAAAPYPDNDIPLAEAYMRRFYSFTRGVHNLEYDVDQVAHLEVHWWVVHRLNFGNENNQGLVKALVDLNLAIYGVEPEDAYRAASNRAQAIYYSDRWVNEGKQKDNDLLIKEEQYLVSAYTALHAALQSKNQFQSMEI